MALPLLRHLQAVVAATFGVTFEGSWLHKVLNLPIDLKDPFPRFTRRVDGVWGIYSLAIADVAITKVGAPLCRSQEHAKNARVALFVGNRPV